MGGRALVAAVYAETAVVAIGRALFRDPFDVVECWDNCTDNSFLIHSDPGLARASRRSIFASRSSSLSRSRRSPPGVSPPRADRAAPARAPVLAAGVAVTDLHAGHAVALIRTPLEAPADSTFAALFVGQCLAVSALALAFGWELVRSTRARGGRAPRRRARAGARAGPLEASTRARGGDALPGSSTGCATATGTSTARSARAPPVASEARGHADRPRRPSDRAARADRTMLQRLLQGQIGSAARLAVENEQLQAEALARLAELRESRARIVEASDAVRRQLERDLHDGAQQRLIALAFGLRLARGTLGADPEPAVAEALSTRSARSPKALAAVRSVANGLFPAALARLRLAYASRNLPSSHPYGSTSAQSPITVSPRRSRPPPTASSGRRSRTPPCTRVRAQSRSARSAARTSSSWTQPTTGSEAPTRNAASALWT
jgi:signal transduction histidine kinase